MRHAKSGIRSAAPDTYTRTGGYIAEAWSRACSIDVDAAVMIAEQHDRQIISNEQAVTALLFMVFTGDYMNTYSQLYS